MNISWSKLAIHLTKFEMELWKHVFFAHSTGFLKSHPKLNNLKCAKIKKFTHLEGRDGCCCNTVLEWELENKKHLAD